MKKNFFNLTNKVVLILSLIFVFSCDNVADTLDDDSASSSDRNKEFMLRASDESPLVDDVITFYDLSIGVNSRTWHFPGGEPEYSNERIPTVTWDASGEQQVELEVAYWDGTFEKRTISICVTDPMFPYFTNTSIKSNESVQFFGTATGSPTPDQFYWEFPGGTPATSTEQNPVVTWSSIGDFDVTLSVSRSGTCGARTFSKPTNLWSFDVQGFEGSSPLTSWIGWDSNVNQLWPAGTLTTEIDGADGSSKTAKVVYNGQGSTAYWGMITRDARASNATIIEGKKYVISFWVKADAPDTIAYIRLVNEIPSWWGEPRRNGDPNQQWYGRGLNNVPVTTDWVYHETEFTANFDGLTGYDQGLGLNSFPEVGFNGATPNVFYIDQIRLQQLD